MLIVTGGKQQFDTEDPIANVEILGTDGTNICSLPPLPAARRGHSQTGIVTCGGRGAEVGNSCVSFLENDGEWQKTHTLSQDRSMHSSWGSPKGVLLIGGWASGKGIYSSTELLNDEGGTSSKFDLNHPVR